MLVFLTLQKINPVFVSRSATQCGRPWQKSVQETALLAIPGDDVAVIAGGIEARMRCIFPSYLAPLSLYIYCGGGRDENYFKNPL